MKEITLKIDGNPAEVGSVSVYMEPVEKETDSRYTLQIPMYDVPLIFDPHRTKPYSEPWPSFIQSNVEELGTFILGRYFVFAAKKINTKKHTYQWVVTTLDDVDQNREFLFLEGRIEKIIS